MNLRLIFSALIIICCYQLTAQETISKRVDNDYRQFREIFDRELESSDTSGYLNKISFHPVSLPAWLSNIPDSDDKIIYAIGISDPGLEQEEAVALAMLRAKIISALFLKPKISSITDNYSKEGDNPASSQFVTKYINYYRLLASLNASQEQFQLVDQYFTSFGEAIVLLKYNRSIPIGDKVDSLMLKIDIYQAERQLKNRFELEEKCEVYGLSKQNNGNEEIDLFYYFYRSVNQFYEIVSRYNGEEIAFPQIVFRYQSLSGSVPFSGTNQASYKLTNGLWKAFLESLIQSYTVAAINRDVEISQLGDHYSSSAQNLSREIVETDPTFRIKGLRINSNRLSVVLNKDEVKH